MFEGKKDAIGSHELKQAGNAIIKGQRQTIVDKTLNGKLNVHGPT